MISVFKKVYDVDGITVRFLRMSYATYINSLNISNNQRNDIAIQMGHNLNQSLKYRKIITDDKMST